MAAPPSRPSMEHRLPVAVVDRCSVAGQGTDTGRQSYQVRFVRGTDPLTGKDVALTGSAQTEKDAFRLGDRLRTHVTESRSSVRSLPASDRSV